MVNDSRPVSLGIIGAGADGWASSSHLPAIVGLHKFLRLEAVSTRRHESASEAQRKFRASKSYDNGFDLIADEDVEAVVVAVSLPQHFELVEAAIELGKHVYCEWPLTADSESATRLRDLATDHDVQTIVGLQAGRPRPVCEAGRHVASGDLGERGLGCNYARRCAIPR